MTPSPAGNGDEAGMRSNTAQQRTEGKEADGRGGKPPLAPSSRNVAQQHQENGTTDNWSGGQQHHRRITSMGQRSTDSPLTDSDMDVRDFAAPVTPPSILQPILSGGSQESSDEPPTHRRLASRGLGKSARKITLREVITNPLEDEAETAIIEALEQHERLMDHENNYHEEKKTDDYAHHKASPSLLPNVPDDTVHMFEDTPGLFRGEPQAKDARQAEDITRPTQGTDSERQHEGVERRIAASPRAGSTYSIGSRTKARHDHPNSNAHEKDTIHSFKDLATQMRMMQIGASHFEDTHGGYLNRVKGEPAQGKHHRRKESEQSRRPAEPEAKPIAEEVSSADKLANAMNVLFKSSLSSQDHRASTRIHHDQDHRASTRIPQTTSNDVEAQQQFEVPKATAGANWKKLRHAVAATSNQPKNDNQNNRVGGSSNDVTTVKLDVESGDADDFEEQNSSEAEFKNKMRSKIARRRASRWGRFKEEVSVDWDIFSDFLKLRKKQIIIFFKIVGLIMVPALIISAVLFYATDNPILGDSNASYSWWLQFVFARQVVTFTIAMISEVFFIDFLALRTRFFLRLGGPFITLFVVQSRGWPYIITLWSIWDFCLLYGHGPFFAHWLFFQDGIGMFNEDNPAGGVVYNMWYFRLLIAGIVCGVATALKRLWVAMYLGKRNCEHYGPQLEGIMRKMLLVSEVASLAREIEESYHDEEEHYLPTTGIYGLDFGDLTRGNMSADEGEDEDADEDEDIETADEERSQKTQEHPPALPSSGKFVSREASKEIDKATLDRQSGLSGKVEPEKQHDRPHLDRQTQISTTQHVKLLKLLDDWEEPEIKTHSKWKKSTIHDVLHYRQALSYMDDRYPFSVSFGPANTRENCIESAQKVYERLMLHTPESRVLPFETISLLALDNYGELKPEKVKVLIRLFRPDRKGNLNLLDFVKSCDSVYKSLRMFRAATANSSQIDLAFEQIINVAFYFVLALVVLSILRLDPLALFLTLSSLFLSFAFMFGSAASKYFEGILFILVRRPYDIGDRIAVSNVNTDAGMHGAATWFVEGVSLFTTTVRFATTNEVATYANGSLACSRIINAARSPKALQFIFMKFGIDVPYEKVKIFHSTIESFVKARPREWISLCGFRATRVEHDLGFIEYLIVLLHRESWQNIVPILDSKATLQSYCLEVAKKLDMKYTAPPLPVNLGGLNLNTSPLMEGFQGSSENDQNNGVATNSTASPNLLAIAEMFKPPEQKKTK